MKLRSVVPVAILAAGILISGCGQEVAKKTTSPNPSAKPKQSAATKENSSATDPAPETKSDPNEISMADLAGYLPTDPVDTVELTDAEKESMAQMMPTHGEASEASTEFAFQDPVRIEADGEPIKVDQPGYACPTLADVNEDGKLDLVVGQFQGGKMRFFKNISEKSDGFEFAAEQWINTGDKAAEVPGVW